MAPVLVLVLMVVLLTMSALLMTPPLNDPAAWLTDIQLSLPVPSVLSTNPVVPPVMLMPCTAPKLTFAPPTQRLPAIPTPPVTVSAPVLLLVLMVLLLITNALVMVPPLNEPAAWLADIQLSLPVPSVLSTNPLVPPVMLTLLAAPRLVLPPTVRLPEALMLTALRLLTPLMLLLVPVVVMLPPT